MTAAEAIRDIRARSEALRQYARAHDRFAELEQITVSRGRVHEAGGARVLALIALRAYRAELDDPEPKP